MLDPIAFPFEHCIHRQSDQFCVTMTKQPWLWVNYLCTVLVRVSIPAQNITIKKQVEGFIQLILPHCCSSAKEVRTGTQAGQEAGADAAAMEACYILACCFLIEPKTTSPGMAPPTMGPSPLDHQWRKCPTAGSPGGTSPTEAPFSVITPACVKLTHKTSQYKLQQVIQYLIVGVSIIYQGKGDSAYTCA